MAHFVVLFAISRGARVCVVHMVSALIEKVNWLPHIDEDKDMWLSNVVTTVDAMLFCTYRCPHWIYRDKKQG